MTTKHTPGPWIARDGVVVASHFGWSGAIVAQPRHHDLGANTYDTRRAEANAHLIAAAPDMLAALQKIVAVNGSTGGAQSLVDEFKFIASQAIAKAEGRP